MREAPNDCERLLREVNENVKIKQNKKQQMYTHNIFIYWLKNTRQI